MYNSKIKSDVVRNVIAKVYINFIYQSYPQRFHTCLQLGWLVGGAGGDQTLDF